MDYLDFDADQPYCSIFMNDAREWAEQIIIIIVSPPTIPSLVYP
jgi:hypothetical protein